MHVFGFSAVIITLIAGAPHSDQRCRTDKRCRMQKGIDDLKNLRTYHYLESVYKLLFFIPVMPRKRSGHPELVEKNRFRLKDCRNDG
ncbi:hypothetical protein BMS3Abin07_00663 [bacterium BMS3Abin07]|nr:hypothetical protein BMS3Abin07_00663 [bacterium BMS3Abin07]GBE32900.1 hypothetical protein BMS3Bbin05_01828 [bacterium BMS3Bbin05]